MAPLAAYRNTRQLGTINSPITKLPAFPVAKAVKIYKGALVALKGGYLVPAAVDPALVVQGCAQDDGDTTASAVDGQDASGNLVNVRVERGAFAWDVAGAGDALAQADVGADVYAYDDHTVAKTNPGGNTRSKAGRLLKIGGVEGIPAGMVVVETTGQQ